MHSDKNQQVLNLQVTDGLTVAVIKDTNHEFIMSTKEVALGYGVSDNAIRRHLKDHSDELIEGSHFSIVSITHSAYRGSYKATMWTKAGVIRLGFFIKSERAKLFRDWAESVMLEVVAPKKILLPMPKKRFKNNLTPDRMASILEDVCQIKDTKLRESLLNKLIPNRPIV